MIACKTCKADQVEVHPYVHHMWWVWRLSRAGFPFDRDDLTLEQWEDLAIIRETVEEITGGHGKQG